MVATSLLFLTTACGNKGGYPSSFRSDFTSECRSGAGAMADLSSSKVSKSTINNYCNCVIDKIQGHYSYDEYSNNPGAAVRYALGFCKGG